MKKLSIAIALMALVLGTNAAVPNATVSATVEKAFLQHFAGASQVSWEFTPDFYFAHFVLDGKTVDAAFNDEGELLGMSRDIPLNELPLNVLQAIRSAYPGTAISSNAVEVNYQGKIFYNAVVDEGKRVVQLKCLPNGKIFVESRVKK